MASASLRGNPVGPVSPGLFLGILALCAALPVWAGTPDSARAFADRIAARYGLAAFPKVESIRFTFHVRRDGGDTARRWTWFPRQDSVVFAGKDPKGLQLQAAYSRRNKYSLASETVAGIDKSFINDRYWLLFPLHLAWDQDLDLKLGEGNKLTVRYPEQGGYTPGDAYDLFASEDGTLRAWDYRRGAADTVTLHADWAPPKLVDGLPLSLERPGKKGFKIWFSDVRVTGLEP